MNLNQSVHERRYFTPIVLLCKPCARYELLFVLVNVGSDVFPKSVILKSTNHHEISITKQFMGNVSVVFFDIEENIPMKKLRLKALLHAGEAASAFHASSLFEHLRRCSTR